MWSQIQQLHRCVCVYILGKCFSNPEKHQTIFILHKLVEFHMHPPGSSSCKRIWYEVLSLKWWILDGYGLTILLWKFWGIKRNLGDNILFVSTWLKDTSWIWKLKHILLQPKSCQLKKKSLFELNVNWYLNLTNPN